VINAKLGMNLDFKSVRFYDRHFRSHDSEVIWRIACLVMKIMDDILYSYSIMRNLTSVLFV
jgi:hypothetical protein